MGIFEFRIARVEEEHLKSIMEGVEPTEEFKTIYAIADTEEIALKKADAYTAKTKYADIEDKKIIR